MMEQIKVNSSSQMSEHGDNVWETSYGPSLQKCPDDNGFDGDDNEEDNSLSDQDWMIPHLYLSMTKTPENINSKTKSKCDHQQPIGKIRIDCRMMDSATTETCSSSSSSSCYRSHGSSQSKGNSILSFRRISTSSHRYLDDESSMGEDGDVFTVCDRRANDETRTNLDYWSQSKTLQHDPVGLSCSEVDSFDDSVHDKTFCSISDHDVDNDEDDCCLYANIEWSPIEDMTVWSLDWNDASPSETTMQSNERECIQLTLQPSPITSWEALYLGLTDIDNDDNDADTFTAIANDFTPLLTTNGPKIRRRTTCLAEPKVLFSSSHCSIKSSTHKKWKIHNRYQSLSLPGACDARPFLPAFFDLDTNAPNQCQTDSCDKTPLTQRSNGSIIMQRKESSLSEVPTVSSSCDDDEDIIRSDDGAVSIERNEELFHWDNCKIHWSTCDEDAAKNGSDWTIVFATGWSELDKVNFYHVHRSVLSQGSSMFQSELIGTSEGYSIFQVEKSLLSAIPEMLDFIYSQSLDVLDLSLMDPATAFSLRRLADHFGVHGLKQAMDRLFD